MSAADPRRRWAVLGVGSLLALVAGTCPTQATAAEPEAPSSPLRVVIDRLRPAVVPTAGELLVTGTVKNVSDSDWSDLKVYLLTSTEPMTTAAEIGDAVVSDPDIEIGDRLIAPGLFQQAPDLGPGESTSFRLAVPAERLRVSGAPGVYWLGVHVLGTDDTGRIEGADGRARTLLPLVPERASTQLALGMPFRRHVVRAADGTLMYERLWADQLRSGRLERARAFAATALGEDDGRSTPPPRQGGSTDSAGAGGGWPLTWLVDGAVLDAADSVSTGNPAVDLTSDGSNEVTAPDDEPDEAETAARTAEDDPDAKAATRWLDRFVADAERAGVLALPYGDLDVSAAASGIEGDDAIAVALGESRTVLSERGIASDPVVAPPSGYLSPEALAVLGPDLRVLLRASALPDDPTDPDDPDDPADPADPADPDDPADPADLAAPRGGGLATTPTAEGIWGPGPGSTHGALAVRQRLLAEAAVHALSQDAAEPLVTVLPPLWDPGRAWKRAEFFDALAEQTWLEGVSLSSVVDPASLGATTVRGEDLVYPDEEAQAEVPAYAVAASAELIDRSLTLQDLLDRGRRHR